MIVDEYASGGAGGNRGIAGTVRWMAPELLLPENFGFAGNLSGQIPSPSTDIYAFGMTILEVKACLHQQKFETNLPTGSNWVSAI